MGGIVTTCRLRMLRAVVFAALCVALAAAAHVSMGDEGLPGCVLVAAFTGTAGATWLLAGRRRGLAVVGGWMVAVQAALHLFFEAAAPMGGPAAGHDASGWVNLLVCEAGRAPTGMAPDELARAAGLNPDVLSVSVVDSMPDMPNMSGMSGMPGMPGMAHAGSMTPAHGMSAGMLVAHLLAALACALLLWRGEAAVAGLFELLYAVAAAVIPLLLFVPYGRDRTPRRRPSTRHHARLPRLVLLSHALVRRGPPFAFAV